MSSNPKGTDMNTAVRTTAPKRVPMEPMRKIALIAGGLYLVTFITSIPALALKGPVLNHVDFILGAGSTSSVVWAGFLDFLCALAGIGTALALYPVVRRHSETAAVSFVASRLLEAAIIVVGVLSLFSIVTLRHDLTGAAGTDAASLVTTGRSLVAIHKWTFLLGPGVMPGINALILATVMYRSRLVPRVIPIVGLIGAPILLASATAMMFGAYDQISTWSALSALPIAAWEFSLGVWLVVKGFKPSPVTEQTTVPLHRSPAALRSLDGAHTGPGDMFGIAAASEVPKKAYARG
jgi:hypothetical protein